MNVSEAIVERRSIRRFTDRSVDRGDVERLLNAAAAAPNHRLTQPWRFYVLGPEAREAYGRALGNRKARKLDDAQKAASVRESVAQEHRELPLMVVVAVVANDNPEIHAEDVGAAMMGIENMSLLAVEMGLGTHIKTGAIMQDPAARAAAGVREGEEIVAVLNLGEPAERPVPKPRELAENLTSWLP